MKLYIEFSPVEVGKDKKIFVLNFEENFFSEVYLVKMALMDYS